LSPRNPGRDQAPTSADGNKWLTLSIVALGVLMVMVDSTVVNVALPSIRSDLGFLEVSVSDLQWVVNAYALSFAVLLLTAGRLADLYGRRLLFLIGLIIFVGASVACGIADDVNILIGFRAVQGIGAAIIAPTSLSIITATFPERERGMAIGIWSAIAGIGVALGPLLGGILTEDLSWRWVFYINVPIGALAVAGTLTWIRESRDPTLERRLDIAGILTSAVMLFSLTFALLKANDYGWGDPRIIGLLVLSVVALVAFIFVERVQKAPMLDLSLFRSKTFSGANATAVFVGFALFGVLFFGSLFTQNVMGWSPIQAGASLLPQMILIMFLAPIVGKLTDRYGPRWFLAGGMAFLTVALVFYARLDFDSTFWTLVPSLLFGGLGFALVLTPLTAAALAGVPVKNAGVGAAVINSTRQIGGSLGLAVMGAIAASVTDAALHEGKSSLDGFVEGFHVLILVAAAVALAGAIVAALTVTGGAPAAEPAAVEPDQLEVHRATTWAVAVPDLLTSPPATRGSSTGRSQTELHLEVTAGPAAGTHIRIGDEPLVFGRIAAGAGSLGNDPRLSRRHAKVSRSNGRLLVEDLGSTGGTFVNGTAIARPTPAAPGDSIDLGATTLRVLAPSAQAPADTRASVGPQQNSGATADVEIEVISGPATGNQIPVGFEPFVLGRAEAGTGKLGNDPELSRRHASISYFDAGRLVVEDLDSTNGTFVNDHRIFMPTILKPGDAIRLGTSTLRVVDSAQSTGGR